jgi:hypothetical protein
MSHAKCSINMKTCKTCNITKQVSEFYKQACRGAFGVRGTCKVCDNTKKAIYRLSNQEKLCFAKKEDYARNRVRYLEGKKAYRQANKGKINALVTARKASVKLRTPKWLTNIDFERIETQYRLAEILTKLHNEPWHVDHVIPLQGKLVSGFHTPSNLQVLRGKDNIAKKNKFEVCYA